MEYTHRAVLICKLDSSVRDLSTTGWGFYLNSLRAFSLLQQLQTSSKSPPPSPLSHKSLEQASPCKLLLSLYGNLRPLVGIQSSGVTSLLYLSMTFRMLWPCKKPQEELLLLLCVPQKYTFYTLQFCLLSFSSSLDLSFLLVLRFLEYGCLCSTLKPQEASFVFYSSVYVTYLHS